MNKLDIHTDKYKYTKKSLLKKNFLKILRYL